MPHTLVAYTEAEEWRFRFRVLLSMALPLPRVLANSFSSVPSTFTSSNCILKLKASTLPVFDHLKCGGVIWITLALNWYPTWKHKMALILLIGSKFSSASYSGMVIHDLDPYHLMMQWLTVSAVYRRAVYTWNCLIQVEIIHDAQVLISHSDRTLAPSSLCYTMG